MPKRKKCESKVREIDQPIDLLLTHVEIRDRKAIRCDNARQTPQEQYVKDKSRANDASDQITAYVFGRSVHAEEGSYCVEVPYNPTCYLRVPLHFEKYPSLIPGILDHLLASIIGSAEHATPYQGCMQGTFVRRLHAFGYRPEPHYLFLKIDTSNRFIYSKLKSYMGSSNTFRRRSKWHDKFYSRFLTPGFLQTTKIHHPDEAQDLLRNQNTMWYTREWFVAHEFLADKIAFLKSIRLDINGFVRVHEGTLCQAPQRGFSNAGNEILCKHATSLRGVDLETIPKGTLAPLVKMTFDIECASHDIVNHPHAHRALDKVSQIGTKTGSILDPQNARHIVFTLGNPTPSQKCTYKKFKHETGLLAGFATFATKNDVDIYNTFNGMAFDWDYLHTRACLALFAQTNTSFSVARARWKNMHEQYKAYMPLQEAYIALTTKYKTREDQETPLFKHKEETLFNQMARVLGRPADKKAFRQPMQDPYKQAIWAVKNEAELKKIYEYFRTQPSIMPWFYMHRMRCQKIGFDIRPKSSAALGNQLLKTPNDGRSNSDMYLYIKTAYSMPVYNLNACAEKFLKDQSKDDLLDHYKRNKTKLAIHLRDVNSTKNAYRMMYEYVASGKPELEKAVCEYCDQDVEVTDLLGMKLGTTFELNSMMKRYRVILQDLTRRAQQYRFMTNVAFEILDKFVFNSYDRTAKAPTYQGAAVLPPTWGLHGAPWEWVFCLDFASLYPTLMRERNFCIRSFLLPCDRARVLVLVKEGKHPPILAVPYDRPYLKGRDPVVVVGPDNCEQDFTNTALFAIMETKDTILPKFLERMGNDRNAVKKKMKTNYSVQSALKTIHEASKKETWTTKEAFAKTITAQKCKLEETISTITSEFKKSKAKKDVQSIDDVLGIVLDVKVKEIKDKLATLGFEYMVFNSEQLAIKVGMNSVYGSLGVKDGTITGLQEIAMSITYCGRMYIYKTRDFCYDYAASTPGWEDLELDIVYGCVFLCIDRHAFLDLCLPNSGIYNVPFPTYAHAQKKATFIICFMVCL